jgi:hypothetical protein
LLSISKAREFGYGNVLFKIDDSGLRKMFQSYIKNNSTFTYELRNMLKGQPSFKIHADSVRPVYNEWAKIKSTINIVATLNGCIEAERVTYQAYKSALNNELPIMLENLVHEKLEELYMIIPVLNLYRELYKIEVENNLECKESA